MIDGGAPLFRQIAEHIETAIVDGTFVEETQVPSTNELAAFHRINPATAAKGVNQLVADGVLYKRRGIGMFVVRGARERLRERLRDDFTRQYLRPLLAAADQLGIEPDHIKKMIDIAVEDGPGQRHRGDR